MKDNSDKVYLEYCFLVPTGVWSSIFDFEKDLSKLFDAMGMEATIIGGSKGSANFKRIVEITKKPTIPAGPVAPPPTSNNAVASQKLKEIAGDSPNVKPVQGVVKTNILKPKERLTAPQYRFKKGRFLKRKGYFQRKAY